MTVPTIDPLHLRGVLGHFATGVTVVTSLAEDGRPVGLVVNSFSSVSLDPPLVLWSLSLTAPSRSAFATHPGFAVNVMGAEAKDETLRFARAGAEKFSGVDWRPGLNGVPVLTSAVAVLECVTEQRVISGDHEILIGRVGRTDSREAPPLIFHRGRFAELGPML